MKVLLIDIDSKIPNLALMKISAWHKSQGDEVFLNSMDGAPDKVYASSVFTKSRTKRNIVDIVYNGIIHPKAITGGPGYDIKKKLPAKIEAMPPDYELYPHKEAYNVTSRGCIRKCGFCIVPEKEGRIRQVATIGEIVKPDSDKLVLLDNNLLASPKAIDSLKEIIERKLKVNINSGIDIRLVTEENAALLAKVDFYTLSFNSRYLTLAFDHIGYESAVRRGVEALNKAGIPSYKLQCYVLIGYDSTPEDDLERVNILRSLKVSPFAMPYVKTPYTKAFSRWVNYHVYKACEFKDYRSGAWQPGQEAMAL